MNKVKQVLLAAVVALVPGAGLVAGVWWLYWTRRRRQVQVDARQQVEHAMASLGAPMPRENVLA